MMEENAAAFLIQADHIAHDLMKPGEPFYNEVVKRFGREYRQWIMMVAQLIV